MPKTEAERKHPSPDLASLVDQLDGFLLILDGQGLLVEAHGAGWADVVEEVTNGQGRPLEDSVRLATGGPLPGLDEALLGNPSTQLWTLNTGAGDKAFQVMLAPRHFEGEVAGVSALATPAASARPSGSAAGEVSEELRRLKALDQLRTNFINTAAHELRTPLTPIKLQVHVLKTIGMDTLDERGHRALEILDRNVDRLGQLVQDVLDGARLQAGHLRLSRRVVDLNAIIQDAVESFDEPAKQADLVLKATLSPPLAVDLDVTRVTQVMFNFLSNAVKYTPGPGHVDVSAQAINGFARVTVRDDGPGLTADQISRLFQPFSQVHDLMQTSKPGTGLGLYITKGIVDAHGGRVGVESDGPGRGSAFFFELPLSDKPVEPLPPKSPFWTKPDPAKALARRVRELI